MWQKRCGSSGVAAAAGGSSGAGPAVGGQSEGRACVRAGAQTWRAHLRGYQRGRSGRASGRNRTWFFKGTTHAEWNDKSSPVKSRSQIKSFASKSTRDYYVFTRCRTRGSTVLLLRA